MKRAFTVSEDVEVILNGERFLLEAGDRIVVEAKKKDDGWPSKVKRGGLRKLMGLDENKPLEDQTSPSKVAAFFKKADKHGRGKVMYAVNSNKTNPFWKKVKKLISAD